MAMHKIALSVLSMTALTLASPAAAQDVFFAGTHELGASAHVSPRDYQWITGQPATGVEIVQYPRDLWPVVGTTPLDKSVAAAVNAATVSDGDRLVSVSQGALAAEAAKQRAVAAGEHVDTVSYGDPINSDGGFLYRFRGIPTFPTTQVTAPCEGCTQTTYALEYDGVADWPDRPQPLAMVNAIMGFVYIHGDYSAARIATAEANGQTVTTTTAEGTTHILIHSPQLPLTMPLRQLGVDQHLVNDLDRILRPIINRAYDGPRNPSVTGNKVTPKPPAAAANPPSPGKRLPSPLQASTKKGHPHEGSQQGTRTHRSADVRQGKGR